MPRVASETSALVPPLHHNAGARHRTPGVSSDAASPFALLVDAMDAPPPKERGSRTPTSARASAQTTDQSPPTPAGPDQSNDGTSEAASSTSQATIKAQADGSESDATDVERSEETASAELLDSLMAGAAGDGSVPQPVPPAAIVNVSVDVLVAQGAPDGESAAAAGITALSADPTAPSAGPDTALPGDQATAENQTATPEQTVPAQTAGTDKVALAVDGDPAAQANEQLTTPQASIDPVETGKSAPEEAAAKPPAPAQTHPTDTPPDAPLLATGKHPAVNSASTEARKNDAATPKSEAATDAEADGGKPTTSTAQAQPATADRPIRGSHGAHADAPTVDDKERQPLGAEIRDAAHSAKPPAEAVHAALLANDRAAAAAVAQSASASGNQSAEPATPIAGLAVEIAARAQAGQNRFEIRLDPPELGRIDVRLDIDRSGQVTSRLIVDRPETLDQLRRDAAGLERALQDAGLKTAQNGLQFSLRDQGFAGRDYNSPSSDAARLVVPDPDLAPVEIPANAYGRMVRTGGIDIRV